MYVGARHPIRRKCGRTHRPRMPQSLDSCATEISSPQGPALWTSTSASSLSTPLLTPTGLSHSHRVGVNRNPPAFQVHFEGQRGPEKKRVDGGGGGSRTRVRSTDPRDLYERIRRFALTSRAPGGRILSGQRRCVLARPRPAHPRSGHPAFLCYRGSRSAGETGKRHPGVKSRDPSSATSYAARASVRLLLLAVVMPAL